MNNINTEFRIKEIDKYIQYLESIISLNNKKIKILYIFIGLLSFATLVCLILLILWYHKGF